MERKNMHILISNDDGIDSPGIQALAKVLKEIADVTVVAPHRERSTSGHSLTLHKPLRCYELKPGFYSVSGTPADCVYMGMRHVLKDKKPDLVVAGINRGANLGNDVYYSGTVAAAREAATSGIKAIAFSLALGHHTENTAYHWDSAAQFAKLFVPLIAKTPVKPYTIINVNVPNLPPNEIKGARLAKQGLRHYSDAITERLDPRNRRYYWLGGEYKGFENIPGSDCVLVDQGYVAITPLKVDSTDYELMDELRKWEVSFEPPR